MEKEIEISTLTATLHGIRPLMCDRYAGDNKTKLEDLDKLYVNSEGFCTLPILNVFSLLSAQNTPSVAKRFYGKQGRDVALGVQAFVNIEANDGKDPMECLIFDADNKAYKSNDKRIRIFSHVARLDKGVPNPKSRPVIPTGWKIHLKFEHQQNEFTSLETLKRMVEQGGTLGLGTFRPIFGRYRVEWI